MGESLPSNLPLAVLLPQHRHAVYEPRLLHDIAVAPAGWAWIGAYALVSMLWIL